VWWQRLQSLGQGSEQPPVDHKPTAEDFTPRALQRAILRQTLQHPATVLPAALAAVAALWSVAIDLSPASLVAMLGCAFVGAGAWVVNYIGRGNTLVEHHIQKLRALRLAYERRQVEEVVLACRQAGFQAGVKEAEELTAAYHKLQRFLDEQRTVPGNASGERFGVLAEETYRHGVEILQHALNLFQALQRIDVRTLEQERQDWIDQRANGVTSASLERNIEAHGKRLERYRRREEELQTLLAQLNELETALDLAHLEVIDLVGQPAGGGVFDSDAASHLERAVEAARRAEQRLRRCGDDDARADEEYLSV
jgi:hypothetical protein